MPQLPRILITQGDVAGIGPEIIVKAWPELTGLCRPVVVGDPRWLTGAHVQVISDPGDPAPAPDRIPCLPGSDQDLAGVVPGRISAAAGRAAYDFLVRAIDLTMAGRADGIVTAPLQKE